MVVEAEIVTAVFECLNDSDEYVKKNCATPIREIVKRTPEVKSILYVHKSNQSNLVSTNDC